jgi:hypothetical protein
MTQQEDTDEEEPIIIHKDVLPNESASQVSIVSGASSSRPSGVNKRKRVAGFDITDYIVLDNKGEFKKEAAYCKPCSKRSRNKKMNVRSSFNSLIRHLEEDHGVVVYEPKAAVPGEGVQTRISSFATATAVIPAYSESNMKKVLVHLACKRDLPFSFVEWAEFRDFVQFLRPGIIILPNHPGANTVSRRNLMRVLQSEYEMYRGFVVALFERNDSKVSLTMDAWTAKNQIPFLGITAHWITEAWRLESVMLAFEHLPGSHSGEHMATCVHGVVQSFGFSIGAITTDNASNNDTLMAHYQVLVGEDVFQASWQWIRYPYISLTF